MLRKAGRFACTMAALLAIAGLSGCVGVIGNTVTVHDDVMARKPVAVDGRIYVVDVRTGHVMALDANACANAGAFQEIPPEKDDN